MLRGNGRVATAVRQPDGGIAVEVRESAPLVERIPALNVPVVRGAVAMLEALAVGLSALSWSAQASGEEDEQLSTAELALTLVAAMALAVALFVAVPTLAASLVRAESPAMRHMAEGATRLGVFLAYLGLLTRVDGMSRVLGYHGAEHKTIHAYEASLPLTVASVRPMSRYHARCGTSFLLLVMLVSTCAFALTGWPASMWERLCWRLALLPLVAGVSYEAVRYAGRHDNALSRAMSAPGLWLQRLTTREPDDQMIEVALTSLKAIVA